MCFVIYIFDVGIHISPARERFANEMYALGLWAPRLMCEMKYENDPIKMRCDIHGSLCEWQCQTANSAQMENDPYFAGRIRSVNEIGRTIRINNNKTPGAV